MPHPIRQRPFGWRTKSELKNKLMTFVQIETIHFRVKSYFKDNSDIHNKHVMAEEFCRKLETFMSSKRYSYSHDVATIQLAYFCGTARKARKKPKFIEGKIIKNPRNRILDIYISHELHIDIDLNEYCKKFFEADKMGCYNIIARKTLNYVYAMTLPPQVKKFNKEKFISDLLEFFVSMGCNVESAAENHNK